MSIEVGGPLSPVRAHCTVDAKQHPSGDIEILLERSGGDKMHRELFVVPDSPEIRLFLNHLTRVAHSG